MLKALATGHRRSCLPFNKPISSISSIRTNISPLARTEAWPTPSAQFVSARSSTNRFFSPRLFSQTASRMGAHAGAEDATRPAPDQALLDIAEYVHHPKFDNPELAYETARLCLIDTLGCGLEALRFPECARLLGPVVDGTTVPNGTRVPGTSYELDPIRGAFNIGTMIRWLDYNDCFLAAEWGHPSDNLGSILAVADWLSRTAAGGSGRGKVFKMRDVLTCMIQAHEIQGGLALENSFNRVGLDHVVLVKVASAAMVSKLLGLTKEQTVDVISQAFVDGQSLRTYRHAPNTGSRKSWAAGDACSRAVNLALLVQKGEMGYPTVLSAKTWGFYDVLFGKKPFKFQRPYTSYIMENVLFKISYPAEFHAQTAVECAHILHNKLKALGKSSDDIERVSIRTQEAAIRIIDKQGPLHNFADRDHTIQYMVAIPLIFGRLTTEDYTDAIAADPRIDPLRAKISCVEDAKFSAEYHAPDKRSIGNAITITLKDGTTLDEVEIEYPVGHKRRREEGKPLLEAKFKRHTEPHYSKAQIEKILEAVSDQKKLENMDVHTFMDLWVKK